MLRQKAEAVEGLTKGIEGLFRKNKVAYAKGYGRLATANSIEVDTLAGGKEVYVKMSLSFISPPPQNAKKIIVATGSEPIELPFLPVRTPPPPTLTPPSVRRKGRRLQHWRTLFEPRPPPPRRHRRRRHWP
jgi:pyruvate/2-oxoglutarate dehydrogenase complex dihydrolipoamide dehydrogenase (E3) component